MRHPWVLNRQLLQAHEIPHEGRRLHCPGGIYGSDDGALKATLILDGADELVA